MKLGVKIFVEGASDRRFLKCYVKYLRDEGHLHMPGMDVDYKNSGGWNTDLRCQEKSMEWEEDRGWRVLFIYDANSDLAEKRRKLGFVPSNKLFLLPNNRDKGMLECLLFSITNKQYVCKFSACFNDYVNCLRTKDLHTHVGTGPKDRLYAYAQAAIGKRPDTVDYLDNDYWDLEHGALKPLREFLIEHLNCGNPPMAGDTPHNGG